MYIISSKFPIATLPLHATIGFMTNDPLHNKTLQVILEELVTYYGWKNLRERINIRCFWNEPSVSSSLKFLRRTAWARKEVEDLYIKTFKK